jgi:DNA-binding CsgD family transcriptional regulator
MRPYSGGPLTATDYERILDVAGECGATRSLSAFRETLIESLASHLGYRHAGLLLGPTRSRIFQDADVLTIGRAIRLVPSYIGHYHHWDPLAQLVARLGVPPAGRTLILDQTRPYLTAENRMYLDQHLYKGGFHAVLCTEGAGDAVHIGMALFDEQESAFGPKDIAVMQRLGRLLTRQAELVTQLPQPPEWTARLTRREAEVARLVGRGCTNQEIAARLYITIDTVKKHVKAACLKARAANRAALAAKMAALGATWA